MFTDEKVAMKLINEKVVRSFVFSTEEFSRMKYSAH